MNARREKDCHNINCPNHRHLDNLLEILEYFAAWKVDTRYDTLEFIASQDLTGCILGLVGICKQYLNSNTRDRVLDQCRHGSYVVEHHFGNCNHYNPNGRLSDFCSFTAKATGIIRENTFQSRSKANTSGDNFFHGDELAARLQKVN